MNQPATHSSVSLLLFSQETKPPSHPFTLFPVLFFLTKSSHIYFWGDPRDPASHSFILFFVYCEDVRLSKIEAKVRVYLYESVILYQRLLLE